MRSHQRFLEELPDVKRILCSLSGSFCRAFRVHSGYPSVLPGRREIKVFRALYVRRSTLWCLWCLAACLLNNGRITCVFWLVDRLFIGNSTLISSGRSLFQRRYDTFKRAMRGIDACSNKMLCCWQFQFQILALLDYCWQEGYCPASCQEPCAGYIFELTRHEIKFVHELLSTLFVN